MLRSVIPGYYLCHSRLRSAQEVLSWLVLYPALCGCIAFRSTEMSVIHFLALYPFALLAWISSYEVGYIENDLLGASSESGGTVRLTLKEAQQLERRFWSILVAKMLVSIGLTALCWKIANTTGTSVNYSGFLATIVATRVVFIAHNALRSRWNLLTFAGLYCLKYLAFLFLFSGHGWTAFAGLAVTAIAIMPLPRVLEYGAKGKFKLQWWKKAVGSLDRFRVRYYAGLCLFSLAMAGTHRTAPPLLFGLSLFMCIFRIAALLAAPRLNVEKNMASY